MQFVTIEYNSQKLSCNTPNVKFGSPAALWGKMTQFILNK